MKVVDNQFICTDKETKDLALIDQMFHQICRYFPCADCPFLNKGKICTASLFLYEVIQRAKLEKKE